jgi:hypothetical protein
MSSTPDAPKPSWKEALRQAMAEAAEKAALPQDTFARNHMGQDAAPEGVILRGPDTQSMSSSPSVLGFKFKHTTLAEQVLQQIEQGRAAKNPQTVVVFTAGDCIDNGPASAAPRSRRP